MKSESNNKNRSRHSWRTTLTVVAGILFVLSFDVILWCVGKMNTMTDFVIASFVGILFVGSIIAILSLTRRVKKNK